jgi:uncharacterized protein
MDPGRDKLEILRSILGRLGSAVIAFSGGVDSTFLLRVAADVPGLGYLAVTTDSPTTTAEETAEARRLAASFGAEHVVVGVDELQTPGYKENPANRCYLCKQTLYPLCRRVADERGYAAVLDGVNTDDLGDYRPGLIAADEYGVRHPLVEAGMSKADIREFSARFGLPTADKPASPCLSSRFPYGTTISHERLRQVEAAEAFLKSLGFGDCRVRHLGRNARVEVPAAELARLLDAETTETVTGRLLGLGFRDVELSRAPLRSGSLNDVLADDYLPTNKRTS